ncbi:MAG TPA: long-chain fatty acid--CoA ligase [Candidatus Limnocylindria bacterium]
MVHASSTRFSGHTALQWREGSRREASWRSVSYEELWDWVERVAIALRACGMRRDDRVAILSRSRPEWLVCDLASMSLGAVTCPIFPGDRVALVEYILRTTKSRFAIVENLQQATKISEIRDRLPGLERVIVLDGDEALPEGTTTLEQVLAAASHTEGAREEWEVGWRSLQRDDVATIVHTSGTTGDPKGVVLTHGNVLHSYEAGSQAIPLDERDLGLSVLPLSHMMERAAGMVVPLGVGAGVAFAEPLIERWAADLLEVRPTVMVTVPPFFERFHKRVLAEVAKAPAWKRRAFDWAVGLGRKRYANHLAGRSDSPWLQLQQAVANRLVFAPIREKTGGRLRMFMSGAAPLPQEIGEFFYGMGMLILEAYGLTETGPVLAMNRPESFKFGTVGPPFPETEIRIDAGTGEILARGPQVMRGYLDKPEETAAAIDAEGWFHTGDIGRFDEAGRLTITDRIKNLVVLSNGKKVSPGPMESALVASPYIAQAVILGEGQLQTGALVAPNFAEVGAWAEARGVRASTPAELASAEEVQGLIEAEVRGLLRDFAPYERPRRVALLPRELDDEHAELTALRKPKRHVVLANWPDQIARLFPSAGNGGGSAT